MDTFTKLEEQYNDVLRKRTEGERQIEVLKHSDAVIGNQTGRIFTEEQNALLTILNQRLLDLIQERDTLLINYTPDHPQVVEQQKKVDEINKEYGPKLAELMKKMKLTPEQREAEQEARKKAKEEGKKGKANAKASSGANADKKGKSKQERDQDYLNSILPPHEYTENGALWIRYVSP